MPGLERLIEKILSDAREKAQSILDAGRAEAASVVAEHERRAEAGKAETLRRAEQEAAARKERLISAAGLAVRDRKLAAKQQLIDRVLSAAAQRLNAMDDRQYAAFLSRRLRGAEYPEGTEIAVPPRYRDNLDLKAIHPGLRLSGADRPVSGGFILVSPDAESNNTFEALIGARRGELERIVAERLF